MIQLFGHAEIIFLLNIGLAIALGLMIGFERESRNKDAGISTSMLIICGSMVFTFISHVVNSDDMSRIAAQVITGIGFIGAGLIIRDGSNIKNLTTAAGVWLMAGVGMAIGFQLYFVAIVAALVATFIPRIPYYKKQESDRQKTEGFDS